MEETMGVVKDRLLDDNARPSVISDCVQLIDAEVASKRGVGGVMIKGGYKAFKKFKPSIVKDAVEALLESFTEALDGVYEEYLSEGTNASFDSWANRRRSSVAGSLLGITDNIIGGTDKVAVKKMYGGMRKIAKKNVEEAVPGIARLVIKYVD
jgi:hypothetical protein